MRTCSSKWSSGVSRPSEDDDERYVVFSMTALVANAWPDTPTRLTLFGLLNAAMRTTEDQTESSNKNSRARSGRGQSSHPSEPHRPSSRAIPRPCNFHENERTWETGHAIRVTQKSTIALFQIRRQRPIALLRHLSCLPPPTPTTLLCISSPFTTHLRLRSHSVTTMARVSG